MEFNKTQIKKLRHSDRLCLFCIAVLVPLFIVGAVLTGVYTFLYSRAKNSITVIIEKKS